LSKNLHLWTS